ncbi:hypothetical protein J6590_084112 [Homalodisca vitripennis]|nr:hypothetical protein J6590_084112 [Homalodisca vitripennis]
MNWFGDATDVSGTNYHFETSYFTMCFILFLVPTNNYFRPALISSEENLMFRELQVALLNSSSSLKTHRSGNHGSGTAFTARRSRLVAHLRERPKFSMRSGSSVLGRRTYLLCELTRMTRGYSWAQYRYSINVLAEMMRRKCFKIRDREIMKATKHEFIG